MALLTLDDHPTESAVATRLSPPVPAPGEDTVPDEVIERWLQSLPWHRRWFARFYRALRKLNPAFPPMSCC